MMDNFVIWYLKRMFGGLSKVFQRVWHDARYGHPISKSLIWASLYSIIGLWFSNSAYIYFMLGWIPFILLMYMWHMYNIYKHGEWYWTRT